MLLLKSVFAGQRRVFCALLLASLLALTMTSVVAAQTSEEGCSCHSTEHAAWDISTHGQLTESGAPVASCETCHGAYTRDHPEADMIPLDSDSSVCIQCHASIAHNWEQTVHAAAGLQCIGCHRAHSQDLRLGDNTLCESCHRDALQDSLHTAHWLGDVTCTNCHMADTVMGDGAQIAAVDTLTATMIAPRHDFVAVAGDNCLDCHAEVVRGVSQTDDQEFLARLDIIQAAAEAPNLRTQLSQAEQTVHTTALFVPMSLGFGVSIGGVLGIAFVWIAARWGQRKGGL